MNTKNEEIAKPQEQDQKQENAVHVHGPHCNHHEAPSTPIMRQAPKVGRNDLCPCGSQKKYKKCCGN
jgi:uncharacterized protein YecA (UPF0149 family)